MNYQLVRSIMRNIRDTHIIYVLEDGETYSGEPATPVIVTTEQLDRIQAGEKVSSVVENWDRQ